MKGSAHANRVCDSEGHCKEGEEKCDCLHVCRDRDLWLWSDHECSGLGGIRNSSSRLLPPEFPVITVFTRPHFFRFRMRKRTKKWMAAVGVEPCQQNIQKNGRNQECHCDLFRSNLIVAQIEFVRGVSVCHDQKWQKFFAAVRSRTHAPHGAQIAPRKAVTLREMVLSSDAFAVDVAAWHDVFLVVICPVLFLAIVYKEVKIMFDEFSEKKFDILRVRFKLPLSGASFERFTVRRVSRLGKQPQITKWRARKRNLETHT